MFVWHDVGFKCARVSAQKKHDEISEIDRKTLTIHGNAQAYKHKYSLQVCQTRRHLYVITKRTAIVYVYIYIYIYIHTHVYISVNPVPPWLPTWKPRTRPKRRPAAASASAGGRIAEEQ